MRNIRMIGMVAMLSVATAAWADTPVMPQHRDNDRTSEDGGTVHFYGAVYASPCVLAAGSRIQAVDLGPISARRFHQAGDRSQPVTVSLYFQDCLKGAAQSRSGLSSLAQGNEWRARTTGESAVQLTLIGESDPVNPQLLRTTGESRGAGIRLMDASGKALNLQTTQHPYLIKPGDSVITLTAALESTGRDVMAGEFSGLLRIKMEYL
ncbi:fimbrial protein [Salmonella enterica subsp. enterica serovar Choleraesuis]|nr:fimbrial protein [Salmonella enterica subsp. enterica serovar Choleraesuis]